jgi:hypothetical protein
MPELAQVAHALTDTAVLYMSAMVPIVAGGAAALTGAVFLCVVRLCFVELRRRERTEVPSRTAPSDR